MSKDNIETLISSGKTILTQVKTDDGYIIDCEITFPRHNEENDTLWTIEIKDTENE